jgi:hypothetical protein
MSEQEKKDVETKAASETQTPNADETKADDATTGDTKASDASASDASASEAKADEAIASDTSAVAHEIGGEAEASSAVAHEIGAPPSRPATSDLAASAESELTPGPLPAPPAPAAPAASAPAAPARPRRSPAQIGRGVFLTLLGLVPLFTIMALDHQIARGPLWGILSTFVLAIGVLDLVGLFTPAYVDLDAARPWRETWIAPEEGEPMVLAPVVAIPVAALLVIGGALFASWSALPWIIVAALGCLVPAALRRPGLLVFTFGSAILIAISFILGAWTTRSMEGVATAGQECLSMVPIALLYWRKFENV